MFTCVFKLKRPRTYVRFVMTFPENCNDCSKRWNFKLKSYQASWNKTASDIRWKATKKKPLTHSWTKLLFCRFKTKRVASYLTSRLRNLLSIGITKKTIPLKLSTVRPKNSSCSYLLGTGTLVFRFAFLYRCWYVQPRCTPHLCIYNAYTTSKMIRTNIITDHPNYNEISLNLSIGYQGSVKANGGRTCYCTFLAGSHFRTKS